MKSFITMKARVEIYLKHRRKMGFQLQIKGKQLLQFAEYVDKKGIIAFS